MAIDLSTITTEPTQVLDIARENNQAIADVARTMQATSSSLITDLNAIQMLETDQKLNDFRIDQSTTIQLQQLQQNTEARMSGVKRSMDALESTLNNQMERLGEIETIRSQPGGDTWRNRREFNKLNVQAGKVSRALDAFTQEKNKQRARAANEGQRIVNDAAMAKQINVRESDYLRAMQLQDKIKLQETKLQQDTNLVNTLRQRQQIDPNSAAAKAELFKDTYEFMYFMQHGTVDGYNETQAGIQDTIFSRMNDEQRRGVMQNTSAYLKSKGTGVALTPDEYVRVTMNSGNLEELKSLAVLLRDRNLLDTLDAAENQAYAQEVANITAQFTPADPNQGISAQEQKQISQMAAAAVSKASARSLIGNLQSSISADISNKSQDGRMFSRVAEAPEAMLSPQMYRPEVIQFYASDEVKDIVSLPDHSNGQTILNVATSLVDSMKQSPAKFTDVEIYSSVSDFITNAAQTNYRAADIAGAPGMKAAMNVLENYGVTSRPRIQVNTAESATIFGSRGNQTYDASYPVDLQKAVEQLSAIRKARELTFGNASRDLTGVAKDVGKFQVDVLKTTSPIYQGYRAATKLFEDK